MNIRLLIGFFFSLMLSSCNSIAPIENPQESSLYPLKEDNLSNSQKWLVKAKLAYKNSDDEGFANLIWDQTNDSHHITVGSSMSLKKFVVSGDKEISQVKFNQEILEIESKDVMTKFIGLPVSLLDLSWWLRGHISPTSYSSNKVFREDGLLSKFSQNGWNVGILNYKRTNQNDIPIQISLEGYNSYLKIKITSWTF